MLARIDAESNNGFLAQRLGSFQPVQTLDQDKARSIGPHQDWGLLAPVQHARGEFVYAPLFQSRAPFDRYVNVRDRKGFMLRILESSNSMDRAVSARYLFFPSGAGPAAPAR
jgi:hypothetical protein